MPSLTHARQTLIQAALRAVSADYTDPHAHSADEAEYAADQLALAARSLTRVVDSLMPDNQPVGWADES